MKLYRILSSLVLTASFLATSLLAGAPLGITDTESSWNDTESVSSSASSGTSFVQAITRTSRSHHRDWASYSRGDTIRVNFRDHLWVLAWSHGSTEAANVILRNDPDSNNMRNVVRAEDIEIRYNHLHGVRMEDDFRWELYHLVGDYRPSDSCVRSNVADIRDTETLVAYSDNLNEFTPVEDIVVGSEGVNAFRHLCFIVEHKGNNELTNGYTTRDDPTSFDGEFFVEFNTTVGRNGQPGGKEWSQPITARIDLSNVR